MTSNSQSVRIGADAESVFRFLSDPARLGHWSFGTWGDPDVGRDGLVTGHSIATGARIHMRIDADPGRLLIDYHLGTDPADLHPRIFARVIPGPVSGHGSDQSTLILTAVRTNGMGDARWARLIRAHAAELDIIKGQIETGYRPGG